MTIAEFLRQALRNQHNALDQAVRDLTPEQLHWVPPNTNANHIGFTLWHYVRTEDNVVQFILQDCQPPAPYLPPIDDASQDRMVNLKPLPEMPARQALANICLTHGHAHFGEICVLRVLRGRPSSVIWGAGRQRIGNACLPAGRDKRMAGSASSACSLGTWRRPRA